MSEEIEETKEKSEVFDGGIEQKKVGWTIAAIALIIVVTYIAIIYFT